MNPVKSLVPLAKWLLRLSAVAIVYSVGDVEIAIGFSFKGLAYLISLAYTVVAIMLLVGGFQRTARLTVISGLLLIIVSLIDLLFVMKFNVPNLLSIIPLSSIGFYFMARGNQG